MKLDNHTTGVNTTASALTIRHVSMEINASLLTLKLSSWYGIVVSLWYFIRKHACVVTIKYIELRPCGAAIPTQNSW